MKKIIIIAVFFAAICVVYTQNILTPPTILKDSDSTYIEKENKTFLLGWNWGSEGRLLDEALYINAYHDLRLDRTDYKNNILLIHAQPDNISGGHNSANLLNSHALHLEPTIIVDSTNDFKPRYGDETGAVFGFNYRNFNYGDTVSSGIDFSRFILNRNTSIGSNGVIVLDSIWDGTILRWLDYPGDSDGRTTTLIDKQENNPQDVSLYHPFNGKQWYLSINLRAIDTVGLSQNLDDTILSLEIPYLMTVYTDSTQKSIDSITSGIVKFDSLPNPYASAKVIEDSLYGNYRGDYLPLDTAIYQPTVFNITGRMLRSAFNTSSSDSSITLSAFARFTGDTVQTGGTYINNPRLQNDNYLNPCSHTEYITKLDVRVRYYGQVGVAIDWIRLETPQTRKLVHGGYDKYIRASLDKMFSILDTHSVNIKLNRFYGSDEMLPNQWFSGRYYNMLLDTLVALELSIKDNPSKRFLYATGMQEFWNGDNIDMYANIAAPYYRYGFESNIDFSIEFLNMSRGYAGKKMFDNTQNNIIDNIRYDSLNSHYDNHLHCSYAKGNSGNTAYAYNEIVDYIKQDGTIHSGTYSDFPIDITTDSEISDFFGVKFQYNTSPLYHSEETMLQFYEDKHILFTKEGFWSNLWINSQKWGYFNYNNSHYIAMLNNYMRRPGTGEEIYKSIFTPIILGTKGIFYWLKTGEIWRNNEHGYPEDFPDNLAIQPRGYSATKTGFDLVLDDSLGGDFLKFTNDPFFGDYGDSTASLQWDYLGIDQSAPRIYLGLKSTRLSIYKANQWITANNDELMNLKLLAWQGKGYTKWQTQDPNFGEAASNFVMDSLIVSDSIKTRKLYQPIDDALGGDYQIVPNDVYETYEETHYDITLLGDKTQDTSMSIENVFYIGVQNRRTDPLIYQQRSDGSWQVDFLSTAELETLCREGGTCPHTGIYHDSIYWQDYIWKQFGCREIVIPFKEKNASDIDYCYQVKEVGADSPNLADAYWMQAPFNHLVDTTIIAGNELRLKLRPGQGKILKVTRQKIPGYVNSGDLSYSNQSKHIVYPTNESEVIATDLSCIQGNVRYHVVYRREEKDTSSTIKKRIYYRRSEEVSAGETDVQWLEPPIMISESMTVNTHLKTDPTQPNDTTILVLCII